MRLGPRRQNPRAKTIGGRGQPDPVAPRGSKRLSHARGPDEVLEDVAHPVGTYRDTRGLCLVDRELECAGESDLVRRAFRISVCSTGSCGFLSVGWPRCFV